LSIKDNRYLQKSEGVNLSFLLLPHLPKCLLRRQILISFLKACKSQRELTIRKHYLHYGGQPDKEDQ
jgi:hypothetical protein